MPNIRHDYRPLSDTMHPLVSLIRLNLRNGKPMISLLWLSLPQMERSVVLQARHLLRQCIFGPRYFEMAFH